MIRIMYIGEELDLSKEGYLFSFSTFPQSLTAYVSRDNPLREFDYVIFDLRGSDY